MDYPDSNNDNEKAMSASGLVLISTVCVSLVPARS